MQEFVEFRIPEGNARKLFRPDEGILLGGSVRKIRLNTNSDRFLEIGDFDRKFRSENRAFYTACIIHREYTKEEIKAANLFRLKIKNTFEPAGEECGTVYDESSACPQCGSGAVQKTQLSLPERRIPRGKDFCQTIAGEILVSRKAKELLTKNETRGVEFMQLNTDVSVNSWYQLLILSKDAKIVAPTQVGIDLFDNDSEGKYRCEKGDLIGLNILSEVSVNHKTLTNTDLQYTQQFVGVRRGFLRPERAILIAQNIREIIGSEKLKGVELEVAHVI
jgi:hypothetical protein